MALVGTMRLAWNEVSSGFLHLSGEAFIVSLSVAVLTRSLETIDNMWKTLSLCFKLGLLPSRLPRVVITAVSSFSISSEASFFNFVILAVESRDRIARFAVWSRHSFRLKHILVALSHLQSLRFPLIDAGHLGSLLWPDFALMEIAQKVLSDVVYRFWSPRLDQWFCLWYSRSVLALYVREWGFSATSLHRCASRLLPRANLRVTAFASSELALCGFRLERIGASGLSLVVNLHFAALTSSASTLRGFRLL